MGSQWQSEGTSQGDKRLGLVQDTGFRQSADRAIKQVMPGQVLPDFPSVRQVRSSFTIGSFVSFFLFLLLKLLLPEQLIQRLIQGLTDGKAEGWIILSRLNQTDGLTRHPMASARSPGSYHARPGPFLFEIFSPHDFPFLFFIAIIHYIFYFCNIYLTFCKKYFDKTKKAWFPQAFLVSSSF